MTPAKRKWRNAIVKALREKGFTKTAARKTAQMTMKKSIASRKRQVSSGPVTHPRRKQPGGALSSFSGVVAARPSASRT